MQLERPAVDDECCFPLICFLNSNVVVILSDVKLSKNFGFGQAINNIQSKWQQVAIFDHDSIEFLVLLFDEENWGYH